MATKQKATTASSAAATAKRSPLSNTAVRLFGAILAVVGILLVTERRSVSAIALTVISVLFIVGGFFIAVSNFRKMISGKKIDNSVIIYFLLGLVVFVAGILLMVFSSSVQKWFIILLGSLIAAYGLAILIRFIIRPRSKSLQVFDIVLAIVAMITGVLIALLALSEVSSASEGICFYIFGGLAIAVGAIDLIAY